MSRIFINYRRQDCQLDSFLFEVLTRRFGHDRVFLDHKSIRPSEDYTKVLTTEVGRCTVMLAVMGPSWLSLTEDAERRSNEIDWVRRELSEAFRRGIPVVPILINDARMPAMSELAAELQALNKCQALSLRRQDFHRDMDRIVDEIQRIDSELVAVDVAAAGLVEGFRDWQALGVHRPITWLSSGFDVSERVAAGELPGYVLRECDLDSDPKTGLRASLAEAARGAGPAARLVVLVGESSAGKTRAAVEAMRAELSGWRLLIPFGVNSLHRLLDQHHSLRHTVIWLDEIHTILSEPAGVEQVRQLLALTEGPIVMLGTLRTDRESALGESAGGDLLHRRAHRIVLKRRPLGKEFAQELERARKLDDPWIADALAKIGRRYGIAEWLAAGPQLLDVLRTARASQNPEERVGAAIVDAAVLSYRAGYTSPCPKALLVDAHRFCLDDPAVPTPSDVFDAALAWARRSVAGASGLLEHQASVGDKAFDYLLGHADCPGSPPVGGALWSVLLRHATIDTVEPIGIAAHRSGFPHIAREVARRRPTPKILAELEDESGLARMANCGDMDAARMLARLLRKQRDKAGLIERADSGDAAAAEQLAKLLIELGEEGELIRRADAGDAAAAFQLAMLMDGRGDEAGLIRRADAGDGPAGARIALKLRTRGDEAGLIRRADSGDSYSALLLAWQLREQGDQSELARRADAGDAAATAELVRLLGERGDEAGLAQRAGAGDQAASRELNDLLRKQMDEVQLAQRATAGDRHAVQSLTFLLYARGDDAGLARLADSGDLGAALHLAFVLAARGDEAGLGRRADAGDAVAALQLAIKLVERGDEVELARRADAGDVAATDLLAKLLSDRGDEAELTRRAKDGDDAAKQRLADLLRARGKSRDADSPQ